jgi:hypothetical protein
LRRYTKGAKGKTGLAAAVGMTAEEFKRLMNLKYLSNLASPGEAGGFLTIINPKL